MPKLLPIQHAFNSGELSPMLYTRSDLDIYHTGVASLYNMYMMLQGPITSREGTKFLSAVVGASGRIFNFKQSWEESYSVVISDDGNIYVSEDISLAFGPELVVNGKFEQELDNWLVEAPNGSVVVVNNFLELTSTNHPSQGFAQVSQPLSTGLHADTVHNLVVEMPDDDSNIIQVRIGTTPEASDILLVSEGGTEINEAFTPGVSNFWLTIYKAPGSTTTKRVDLIAIKASLTDPEFTGFAHPWTNNLEYIHAKMPPGDDVIYFTHPNFPPQVLEHLGPSSWSFGAAVFTSEPAIWTGTSYPRTLEFFQGRSWWGGPGDVFFASKSGSFLDLTVGSADDDALQFDMAKRGEIMWFVGIRNLLVGTRTGEHIVTSEGGIITPSDINVEQQSAYGSNFCQPIELGGKAIYVTEDGQRVQDIGWEWTAEQWVSHDLTFSAEHLFLDTTIKELVQDYTSLKTFPCILSNGTIALCSYDIQRQNLGWARHITPNGFITSMCRIQIETEQHFLILINRGVKDDEEDNLLFVESTGFFTYLDATHEEFSEPGKDTIDDGIFLKNKEVAVKIDDAIHPNVTLDENGQADLNWSGHYIVYGLPYEQWVKLLPRDFPHEGGSTTSLKKRWNKIWVRVLSSILPFVGNSETADRTPATPMNTREPLTSRDIQVTTLGYSKGEIEIYNNLPYPMTITGVFGEMEVDKL